MESFDAEGMLQGQAELWKYMFNLADSKSLRCAVELRIADIIHSQGCPITLSQISSGIASPSVDITYLARIMRLLVRNKIFTFNPQSDGQDTLYGLTHSSRWLLHDAELSLSPMLLLQSHLYLVGPWSHLSGCLLLKRRWYCFWKLHGHELWEFASINPEFNKIFNDAMACTAKITVTAIVSGYKNGFDCIRSLVDVGGGIGTTIPEIVKSYPHIKGINFDLPHVVETTPGCEGVSCVAGDMFKFVPNADAVFMKWIMHDWSDEDCVKILKNCRKAIPEKTGKVIIVDVVLQPEGDGLFDNTGLVFDLAMMAFCRGGKERTELEWKKVLEEGGFPRYRIIRIPALQSIIEAFPH